MIDLVVGLGLTLTVFYLLQYVIKPHGFWRKIGDRYGRKRILIGMILIYMIVNFITYVYLDHILANHVKSALFLPIIWHFTLNDILEKEHT